MRRFQHAIVGAIMTGAVTLTAAGAASAQTFSYAGPPVAIPDNAGEVFAPITVAGVAVVGVFTVSIDGAVCTDAIGATTVGIDHTFAADLDIYLESPLGTRVELSTDNGGAGNNFCQTVFDDAAGTSITSVVAADAPFTGVFAPEGLLSALAGEVGDGEWRLVVSDDAGVDTGSIRAWSIHFVAPPPPPPVVVPTLTEWAMMLLGGLLALAGTVAATRARPVRIRRN